MLGLGAVDLIGRFGGNEKSRGMRVKEMKYITTRSFGVVGGQPKLKESQQSATQHIGDPPSRWGEGSKKLFWHQSNFFLKIKKSY